MSLNWGMDKENVVHSQMAQGVKAPDLKSGDLKSVPAAHKGGRRGMFGLQSMCQGMCALWHVRTVACVPHAQTTIYI